MQVVATEAAVIGAGPAGFTTALALAKSGIATALVAPPYDAAHAGKDARTTALMGPSVDLLRNLGVWELCEARSAAIAAVRLADSLGGILRAPELVFTAAELGLPSFGANIANSDLIAALDAAAQGCPNLHRVVTTGVTCVTPGAASVRVSLAEGGVRGNQAGSRRRWPGLDSAPRGGHRAPPMELPTSRCCSQLYPHARSQWSGERVASAHRAADNRAVAGAVLELGVGGGAKRGPAPDDAWRFRVRPGAARAFVRLVGRHLRGRALARCIRSSEPARRAWRRGALHWSAKQPMWCPRSVRKA